MPALPEGFATITPTLVVPDASGAIEQYKKAFGAKEDYRMPAKDPNKIMHASVTIGNSKIFIADQDPDKKMELTHSDFYVYVPDVDQSFRMAKDAGMRELYPVEDTFWGDRTGGVKDMFGNCWSLATHVRDVSQQEMEEAKKKYMAKMG